MKSTMPVWRCLLFLAPLLLAACAGGQGGDDDEIAPDDRGVVSVQSAIPVRTAFHLTIEAWGTAVGDPTKTRTLSLGHGGEVESLLVAPGERVVRGQALLAIAPDPAARVAMEQAQSALVLARDELARTKQMATQHLATQSQLAAARKNLADAEAALASQRALGGGTSREILSAPAEGVITSIDVKRGDRFAANTALIGFAPDQALVAELGVLPADGPRLKVGQAVVLDSVDGGGRHVAGSITMVGQAIDPQSRLLPVRASLPPDAGIVNGAAVHARIRVADVEAWSVPRAAVLHDERGDYLFQIESGRAHRADVTLRSADGDPVGVDGPLDPKATVIVQGVYELSDGDQVRGGSK
jgi:RND family efflux transporter MFP subunit